MTRRLPPLALYGPDWLAAVQANDDFIERTTMQVLRLEREFLYNGVKLPDTTPTMTPEQVRDTYTHLYPEIATAAIEGPETVAGKLVYRFVRAIGAKG
ncbi:MAG: PRTRC system protein C [Terriglobales bacterium]